MGWLRTHSFLPVVALLALAAIAATQLSRARATDNYEAQAALADVRGQLSELQVLPWMWAMAPDEPMTPEKAIQRLASFDRAVHKRLFQVKGVHAGVDFDAVHARVDANLAATREAARFATSEPFKRVATSGTAGADMSDLLALATLPVLAERQGETYKQAARALTRAQNAYTARAKSRSRQADVVSAGAILLLLAAFACFYRRSVAARSRAEELTAAVESLLADSREEALSDHLTGLPNRRALITHLEQSLKSDERVVLALFDLDGFKGVNDTLGHPAGDALLRRRAQQLADELGDRGTAYRLGGDEFCVLAPLGDDDPMELVESARSALAEDGPGYEVGASVGVAVLPHDGESVAAALRVADRRLYEDKRYRREPRLYREAA